MTTALTITVAGKEHAVSVRDPVLGNVTVLEALGRVMSQYLAPERFLEVCVTALHANERLVKSTPTSKVRAVCEAARWGLMPTGTRDGGYLIPRWNKRLGQFEATFQPSYMGVMAIVRRACPVKRIVCEVVREHDAFALNPLETPPIHHEVLHRSAKERGRLTNVYAAVWLMNGEFQYRVLDSEDIERAKARSESADDPHSPWVLDEVEQWRKTAIHRVAKLLPVQEVLPWDNERDEEPEEGPQAPAPGDLVPKSTRVLREFLVPAETDLVVPAGPYGEDKIHDPSSYHELAKARIAELDDVIHEAPADAHTRGLADLYAAAHDAGLDDLAVSAEVEMEYVGRKPRDLTPDEIASMTKTYREVAAKAAEQKKEKKK